MEANQGNLEPMGLYRTNMEDSLKSGGPQEKIPG
jgi:hypothetical protein